MSRSHKSKAIKKIFVTGGAGFIGSAIIRRVINETPHHVVNIDKITYAGNLKNVKCVSESGRYHFAKTDICDRNSIQKLFQIHRPDLVIHCAAESHVDRSIYGSEAFIQTNIVGTFSLLEQTRLYWEELDGDKKTDFRFHHISTDEVYGDLSHPDDFTLKEKFPVFNETSAYNPSSPYSASKAASDHIVRAWHRTYGLPILITNCSNNYGPYQYPEKLIPLMIFKGINNLKMPVYGDGSQIRDWLYVDDHASAVLLIADNAAPGKTYLVGGQNEIRNIDVVSAICTTLDKLKPKSASYLEQISYVSDRAGHDRRYAIDPSVLQRDFNWRPKESFHTGLIKTVNWYLEHLDWSARNEIAF